MADYAPGSFDCLITDVSMPGRSGLELLERLRSLGSTLPVIIVTADASATTRSRATKSGVHAFLTKPVNSDELIAHLRSALQRTGNGQEPRSDG